MHFVVAIALSSFAIASPAVAQQARVSARVVQSDSLLVKRKELEGVMLKQRALAQEIQRASMALRRAGSEDEREVIRVKLTDLTDRMGATLAELQMVQAHLQSLCESRPGPEGWLGISFNADADVTMSPNATTVSFRKYPVIVAVDPGSPAHKAGLASGDEIVTIDGRDMVSVTLDVAALLKPYAQLPVRYRRDGALHTVSVLIEPKPKGYVSACPWIDAVVAAPLAMQPKVLLRPTPTGFGYVITTDSAKRAVAKPRSPTSPQEVLVPRGATPVLPPTPYTLLRFQSGLSGPHAVVAGAALIPLSADLREGLGIEDGFLVMDVLRGTPAFEAGLRPGDVIVSVNGRKPSSIPALIKALDETSDGSWSLRVWSRRTGPRVVRLQLR